MSARRSFKIAIAYLFFIAVASATVALHAYRNDRYGFQIGVPGLFTKSDHAPQNGDGNTWYSQDGHTQLAVYGSNNGGMRLHDAYLQDLAMIPGRTFLYHKLGGNWFVISWVNRDRVVYEKTFVGPESQNSFTITYPLSRRSELDPIVAQIEKSFRPGDLSIAH